MEKALRAIEEGELIGWLHEGLDAGVDQVHLRAGCAPLGTGHGGARRLGTRPLVDEDLLAVTEILLRRCYVPESVAEDRCDAAHELAMLCELRDRALVVPFLGRDDRGLFVVLELARPLRP